MNSGSRRGRAVFAAVTVAAATAVGIGPTGGAPAHAADCTDAQTIVLNTGASFDPTAWRLYTYDTAGQKLGDVALPVEYGDIALTADGTLYGVRLAPPATLDRIDPATGTAEASVALPAPLASLSLNSLTALPDGTLLTGAASTPVVFQIDPAGNVTEFAELPTGHRPAGDFLSLPDGDVLAVTRVSPVTWLVRIKPDRTSIPVGTVPAAYGAALVAGAVFLAGITGDLLRVTAVPTEPGSDPIPVTTPAATGLPFYGATSIGDGGLCAPTLTLTKALGSARATPADQFTVVVRAGTPDGPVVSSLATATTIGTGDTVTPGTGTTGTFAAAAGTTYYLDEVGDGTTDLTPYTRSVTCTDPTGATPDLPDGAPLPAAVTPGPGAQLDCVVTNVVPPPPTPRIELTKTVEPRQATRAGEEVTFRFAVTNVGNVAVNDVRIREIEFSGTSVLRDAGCDRPLDRLPVGDSVACRARYRLSQADIDAGGVANVAAAVATYGGNEVLSNTAEASVVAAPEPGVALTKSSDTALVTGTGQRIDYRFDVTNTGNVSVDGLRIDDPRVPTVACPAGIIAPGVTATCVGTYVVTDDDMAHDTLVNTAVATLATPPAGSGVPDTVTATWSVSIPVEAAGLAVVKHATPPDAVTVGDTIDFTFDVTNTGRVDLTDVSVDDPMLPAVTCPATALAPGTSMACHAAYVATADDVASGVVNVASVSATTPTGRTVEARSNTVTVAVAARPPTPPTDPGPGPDPGGGPGDTPGPGGGPSPVLPVTGSAVQPLVLAAAGFLALGAALAALAPRVGRR